MGKRKYILRNVAFLAGLCVFVNCISGCSIISVLVGPGSAPPENLMPGLSQQYVDTTYGQPVAAGMSGDGSEYAEQIRFYNGSSKDAKAVRVALYTLLDVPTYLIAEICLFPLELSIQEGYPRYEYFVVYDDSDRVVRAVDIDSPEGRILYALPWTAPRPRCVHDNPNCANCTKMEKNGVVIVGKCTHGNRICPHRYSGQLERSPTHRLKPSERSRRRINEETETQCQITVNKDVHKNTKIEELQSLKAAGLLTDKEYTEMLNRVLNSAK